MYNQQPIRCAYVCDNRCCCLGVVGHTAAAPQRRRPPADQQIHQQFNMNVGNTTTKDMGLPRSLQKDACDGKQQLPAARWEAATARCACTLKREPALRRGLLVAANRRLAASTFSLPLSCVEASGAWLQLCVWGIGCRVRGSKPPAPEADPIPKPRLRHLRQQHRQALWAAESDQAAPGHAGRWVSACSSRR